MRESLKKMVWKIAIKNLSRYSGNGCFQKCYRRSRDSLDAHISLGTQPQTSQATKNENDEKNIFAGKWFVCVWTLNDYAKIL
jgi:hypothetical protein